MVTGADVFRSCPVSLDRPNLAATRCTALDPAGSASGKAPTGDYPNCCLGNHRADKTSPGLGWTKQHFENFFQSASEHEGKIPGPPDHYDTKPHLSTRCYRPQLQPLFL